jgi:hypothetical protein
MGMAKNEVLGIQINLAKSPTASTNLINKCERLDSFIILMQEPRVHKGKINLSGIKCHYHSATAEDKPRAAIGHSAKYPPDKLRDSIAFANNKGLKYIIGIDSNAHSTIWGCPRDNPRGKLLEESIQRCGFL